MTVNAPNGRAGKRAAAFLIRAQIDKGSDATRLQYVMQISLGSVPLTVGSREAGGMSGILHGEPIRESAAGAT